jgi:hypothetical protein
MTSPPGVGGAKGGMGQFKCNHCGKSGHKYADCWQRDKNASKRPQNYRMPAKQAQANVNKKTKEKTIEYLMAGSTFPTNHKILIDPNVGITDTAATVHTTPYSQGMKNCKKATEDDAITVGNGSKESASQIANITGTICDKEGNELNRTQLTEVTHLPQASLICLVLRDYKHKVGCWVATRNLSG